MTKKDEITNPFDKPETKPYRVLSPVATDHLCLPGETIELDDVNAAELLTLGAVEPVAEAAA